MPAFAIGERVQRLEPRALTAATVLEIEMTDTVPNYRMAYDEGGEGWWPEGTLASASGA